ncbi:hypothetical protein [Mucilaginibacter psychrotolerans]|uniref:Uncharacterized protein n=1 Tax=Mucilaginibacter psychrotolerans TaxID=1524096 RepID=A0A4Y8S4F4_9SPHI|nr:hypothetical protein [Mucilaginibacter psychrotolerans]TFF33561.1 hypothetical protein E2R66_25130 [Mucilaginibacter psychrotolerans]
MKKLIYIFIPICFLCIKCAAQTKLMPGIIKGKRETFSVQRIERKFSDSPREIIVTNKRNKYDNGLPVPKEPNFIRMNPKDIHLDTIEIRKVVYRVMADKINILKQNKEKISIGMVFKPSGSVVDIWFTLNENTLITATEMERLDNELRTSIIARFTGKQYLKYEAIPGNIIPPVTFQ